MRRELAVIANVAAAALLFSTGIPTPTARIGEADAEGGPPDRDSALA
jgi:hypothetical protein